MNTEALGGTAGFEFIAGESNEQQLWAEVYTRQFPDEYDFENLSPEDQQELLTELREEVELLDEETCIMQRHAEQLRLVCPSQAQLDTPNNKSLMMFVTGSRAPNSEDKKEAGGFDNVNESSSSSSGGDGAVAASNSAVGTYPSLSGQTTRRGQAYSRKSADAGDSYVMLEDRIAMLTKERERLRQQKEREERDNEHLRELLYATVEEALNRTRELRLETIQFKREVISEVTCTASADDLLRYMANRHKAQSKYLDKLNAQCTAAERSITQYQRHLKQRHAAGEAFHAVDFEQLRIENQQFIERIDRKNLELVELKGTSTRTVQTLNSLMDTLNSLTAEQSRLKKDFKSRCEYLARLKREMESVTQEANIAERKNAIIKAQHESVRVPKIENYMAQKAEEYELQKADRNWQRKVEIATGQLNLVKQQIRVLAIATDPLRKRRRLLAHRRAATAARSSSFGPKRGRNQLTNTSQFADISGSIDVRAQGPYLVSGSKSLLRMKQGK
ncbi:putative protein of unknown function (DUF4201) [Trypanosoma vivax]|nr:hypothetical protein TRVL_02914 [Trypanosoma vivax]KAH8611744.1 putative protein of unknown function (DUF4201) [Trypanosoma vivax]